eukprot:gene7885-10701_t
MHSLFIFLVIAVVLVTDCASLVVAKSVDRRKITNFAPNNEHLNHSLRSTRISSIVRSLENSIPITVSANAAGSIVSNPWLVLALKVAGPIFFLGLQLSSLMTAMKVIQIKSVGKLSSFPFFSLVTNCFIWTLYGFLKKDNTVFLPNSSGLAVGIFCVATFQKYSLDKYTNFYLVSGAIIALSAFLAYSGSVQLLGLIGCVLAIILSGSPLAVVKTVIAEKSTASMPFTTSLVMWLNNFSWMSYGALVAHDPLIWGPNLFGFVLASCQMLLFAIYGFAK